MHGYTCYSGSTRRAILCGGSAVLTTLVTAGVGGSARAEPLLESLRIYCGAAAGSTPDIVARLVAEQLTGRYAKRCIVENRPGAAGRIAVNALKAAPADGSTMLLGGVGISALNPLLYATLGYDPNVDLRPVSLAAEMSLALAVGPAVPDGVSTVSRLIEWMRRNPALANIGSPGVGTLPHLSESMLFRAADVAWVHVPYSGGAPVVTSLLSGQIAALILPEAVLNPHRAAGKLRVLATSGSQRSPLMPEVASFVEQGYPELSVMEWFAFYMSGEVPQTTIDLASQSLRDATAQPELVRAFAALGMTAASSTPTELTTRIAAEKRVWERVIRDAEIRAQ